TGDNVAADLGQRAGHAPRLLVRERARLGPGRAEDRDPVALAPGRPQPGQVADDVPEAEHGADEDLLDVLLVGEANRPLTALGRRRRAHGASLDYSRTMKEKRHRVSRRCYRSGVDALLGTQTRR